MNSVSKMADQLKSTYTTSRSYTGDFVVGGKYRVIRKIGSGSFGDIYLGISVVCGEEVAIKMEALNARHPQLLYEYKLYKLMMGGVGIPRIRYYGQERNYNVLVMDLLGPSLEDLFNFCTRHFTIKTVLMLVDQMIGRLEFLHCKHFIHRDIKPGMLNQLFIFLRSFVVHFFESKFLFMIFVHGFNFFPSFSPNCR